MPPTRPGLTRRQLLARGAAALGASSLGVGLYTWRVEPHWVETVRRPLPVAGLPPRLEGATLVQVSDLHVGPRVDEGYLAETLRSAAALEPDLLVVTGDLVTWRGEEQLRALDRVLAHLPRGRLATLGCLGNHDFGVAWSEPDVADRVARVAADRGLRVLRNESAVVSGLQIVGLEDLWAPSFDPGGALAARDPGLPTLALCHNPDAVDLPAWAGFRGWILAGHTHGGQCRPPFLPPPLLPVANRRYTAGPFDLAENRHLYINRGLGHLLRVRFNVRPEVTAFTLTRG
jgi:uncharacterized protein